jgi:hypothetical protein
VGCAVRPRLYRVYARYGAYLPAYSTSLVQAVELGWLPREWYSKPVQQAIATGCDAFLPNKTTNSTSTNTGTKPSQAKLQSAAPASLGPADAWYSQFPVWQFLLGLTVGNVIGVLAYLYFASKVGSQVLCSWPGPGGHAYTPIADRQDAV